jgi:hypothetical protein
MSGLENTRDTSRSAQASQALRFVLMIGVVSFFADFT